MALFSIIDPIEIYRRRAERAELDLLSGRWKQHTDFITAYIGSRLQIPPQATMLDIGCGDGSLLAAHADRLSRGIGTVPTEEERALLSAQAHGAAIEYRTCLATELPFDDASFDVVVMNGVILLLATRDEAERTIAEIARVARPGASIWLGEALIVPRRKPFRFGSALRDLGRLVTGKPIRRMRAQLVTKPDWIRAVAAKHGMTVVSEEAHQMLDASGNQILSKERRDFLLRRN